ncbi:acid phosphatase 1-like [Typha angustifolia]|uniref:acid phosphatase 1-like n=1 Tax=Typha angustifolia TaxID=59011 RepID=UPI003C2DE5B2
MNFPILSFLYIPIPHLSRFQIRAMKPISLILLVSLLPLVSLASSHDPFDAHLLPRPLVLELPSSLTSDDPIHSPSSLDNKEEELLHLKCTSWRFAGEANNLVPWKTIPVDCAGYMKDYITGPAYRFDLEMVAHEAMAYARSVRLGEDGNDVWVFDVDETLLSNLPYYADHGYGLEVFNPHEFDKWVEKAMAPAIPSSLMLYEEVRALGFKVLLLTGRSEAHKAVTVENLKKVGFRDWDKLLLRGSNDREKPATMYKSEKRRELEADGYRIQGNSGDQWSDLLGSSMSSRSFKLPNPMYYIP